MTVRDRDGRVREPHVAEPRYTCAEVIDQPYLNDFSKLKLTWLDSKSNATARAHKTSLLLESSIWVVTCREVVLRRLTAGH